MKVKITFKEIILWLIFLGLAIFVTVLLSKLAKESIVDKGEIIFTKNLTLQNSLDHLEIKVPDTKSIVVKLQLKDLIGDKRMYTAEFNQQEEGEDFPTRGSVTLIHDFIFDNPKYKIIPMAVNFGGSGEFVYLILLQKTENGLKHVDSVAVGDRIDVVSFVEKDTKIIFNYKSHHKSQAMAEEPSVLTHLEFTIKDFKFIEGFKYFNSTADDIVIKKVKINSDTDRTVFVSGETRGSWLFENSAPIELISEDSTVLSNSIISSSVGWMTNLFIPFETTLKMTEYVGRAKVILKNDNPSGKPSNDKKVEFWVNIK